MFSTLLMYLSERLDLIQANVSSTMTKTINIDMLTESYKRPMCLLCGERPGRSAGKSVAGIQQWRKYCSSCDSNRYRKQREVELVCSECDFVAEDSCQIDTVDDKSLCSNCNRLRVKRLKQVEHDGYQLTVDATVDWGNIRL